jgi:hypothetical protein
MTQGENFVNLKGVIGKPFFKKVGASASVSLFKSPLSVSIDGNSKKSVEINIMAWSEVAEGLNAAGEGTAVHIHGHIEEKSYDAKCAHCGADEKRYTTEFVVDNFAVVDDTVGENFVNLKGTIMYPDFKKVGKNNISLFKGKLKSPFIGNGGKEAAHYIKISSWRENADALKGVGDSQWVHIHGHVETQTYDGHCKHCKGISAKNWTEVVVDQFVPITE